MNDLLSLVSFYLSDIDLLYIPRNNNINNDNNNPATCILFPCPMNI